MVKFNVNSGEISGEPRDVIEFTIELQLMENDKEYKAECEELAKQKLKADLLEASQRLAKLISTGCIEEIDEEVAE